MKWPHPWKLVKDLERKLQENQALAKRVAQEGVAEQARTRDVRESLRPYKTT